MIDTKCEGMIRLRDLDDDFYEFDDTNYCVVGVRTKRKFTLGDAVKVRVERCDLLRKQIDLKMINGYSKIPETPAGRRQKQEIHGKRKTYSKKRKSKTR